VLNAWTARIFLEKNERGNSATPLELWVIWQQIV
jgi:hypothetical protein